MSLLGEKFPHFTAETLDGNQMASDRMLSDWSGGRWLVVGYGSRETRVVADKMLRDVGGEILDEIGVVHVVALAGIPKLIRKLPMLAIQAEYTAMVEDVGARLATRGVSLGPDAIRRRINLVPDWEGDLIEASPMKGKVDEVNLLLVDGTGTIKHHAVGWADDTRARALTMLREVAEDRPANTAK